VDRRPSLEIDLTDEEATQAIRNNLGIGPRQGRSLEENRSQHPRAYAPPWTAEEERRLAEMHGNGHSIESISTAIQRQPGGVRSRLRNSVCSSRTRSP
jgi:hypothetical protein